MRISTWNVNGIRRRHAEVVEWVARFAPDVLCLQELKAAPGQIPEQLTALPDYWSHWHGAPGGYSGVSLHLRKSWASEAPVFDSPEFDFECRILQAKVGTVHFMSAYVPNGGKDYDAKLSFLQALHDHVRSLHKRNEQVVLCGDMNVARTEMDVHPSQRDPSHIGQRPDERALFEALIAEGLADVGRQCNPINDRYFTWWPYWRHARERNLGWRLDYMLTSKAIAERVSGSEVHRDYGSSDHGPVVVDLEERL